MENSSNYVHICGTVCGRAELSHISRGEKFYVFPLAASRLSGSVDRVNITVRERLLNAVPDEGGKLSVTGELRSFNNRSGEGAKLVISVFSRELSEYDGEDENLVILSGTLCREPKLRSTPMGRDICDLMLAVNRNYARSDYLPCICWGSKAIEAAAWGVGDRIRLEGRIQSRTYIKLSDDMPQERVAFEVSAAAAELIL